MPSKHFLLYEELSKKYNRLDPHHETWELWIKANKTSVEVFEVAIGTILVQNTNWHNVNKAIANFKKNSVFSFEKIDLTPLNKLEELIKPAGFYIQKALYLKSLSELFLKYYTTKKLPNRSELLNCKGIGKETADSILVYCFQQPSPIVGTYTRRFLARIKGTHKYLKFSYEKIQQELKNDLKNDYTILGIYHALIVCHSQNLCQKNSPNCSQCFLYPNCLYGKNKDNDLIVADIQKEITKTKNKRNKN